MTARIWKSARLTVSALAISACGAVSAQAEDNGWEYGAFIYLWAAGFDGTTTTGQDFSLSFSDVLDKLDFAFMGALEARKDRLSFMGDMQYLNLSEGKNSAVGPGIPATADMSMQGLVFTGTAGYDLATRSDNSRFTITGGFRYLDMDTTVNIAVGGGSRRISPPLKNWDAVIGFRGRHQLAERWHLSYIADIGAGESDLTWQAAVTLDYRINNWDLSFGYRHMEWDIGNSRAVSNFAIKGPFLGAKFYF